MHRSFRALARTLLAPILVVSAAGCRSVYERRGQTMSSGLIGCRPEDIDVHRSQTTRGSYTARCQGRTFICSEAGEEVHCTESLESSDAAGRSPDDSTSGQEAELTELSADGRRVVRPSMVSRNTRLTFFAWPDAPTSDVSLRVDHPGTVSTRRTCAASLVTEGSDEPSQRTRFTERYNGDISEFSVSRRTLERVSRAGNVTFRLRDTLVPLGSGAQTRFEELLQRR